MVLPEDEEVDVVAGGEGLEEFGEDVAGRGGGGGVVVRLLNN